MIFICELRQIQRISIIIISAGQIPVNGDSRENGRFSSAGKAADRHCRWLGNEHFPAISAGDCSDCLLFGDNKVTFPGNSFNFLNRLHK